MTVLSDDYCCKIGRIIDMYDIIPGLDMEDANRQLVFRWRGERGYPEMGLRPLVGWIHRAMLRDVYTEHGRSTLDPHLESDYEALTGDDEDRKQMVLTDLQSGGLDGEQLIADFASSPTLYRHFTDCLDVEKSRTNKPTNWEIENLEYAQNNITAEISAALRSLENKGQLPGATTADIVVRVYLECPICGKQISLNQAQQQGYICEEHLSTVDE